MKRLIGVGGRLPKFLKSNNYIMHRLGNRFTRVVLKESSGGYPT